MIVIEVIILLGFGWLGIMAPIKNKWKKELFVYIIFFLLGSSLLILQTAGIKMPFLMDEISKLFKNVLHLSYD